MAQLGGLSLRKGAAHAIKYQSTLRYRNKYFFFFQEVFLFERLQHHPHQEDLRHLKCIVIARPEESVSLLSTELANPRLRERESTIVCIPLITYLVRYLHKIRRWPLFGLWLTSFEMILWENLLIFVITFEWCTTVLWIRIRSDPNLFAGSGSVIINFGSGSDELVLTSICKLSI